MGIENTLAPWLGKTTKMIENHVHDLFFEHNISLTKIQWVFLKKVQEKNGVPQQELAFLTGRDKTSLTRLVNTMEKKGLVARIPSKLDRRINNIYITKKGDVLFKETLPIMAQFVTSLQENISEEEIAQTINVIKKIQENLNIKSAKSCSNS
ncbi:MarR family winged helix-turn-helix transcriptional regulator [Tenacibaculum sp. HL-MS23]|uniref:MarR family winged helix-turn-helix transcriptional regulator n=1 Tax=Tenacibaculum TaxID=104267 RepID=UPI001C4F93CC|nr:MULTISPECIES: MarR family winged helix-turn-helix transcriptional regulator [Tenacibaculum]QXP74050.1 winged helix-turn-helix transcriptional regulator [Tenacibaculum sp. AHE14PA]QXP75582.1 winged helix-turn-helix transcriptional regulator [Tenacibaculum sp. AHE15PA]WNW02138.1 MarR family winged helix-turn-helix transcriptional regulator [Tenacibaculum sp. HL-MS23]